MAGEFFCNVPESVTGQAGAGLCQWPMGHVLTWTVTRAMPGWSPADLVDVYRDAWKVWDEVSGIKIEYVTDPARANILIGARVIDGPFGVLAEAELPCGNIFPNTQLRVWFDENDRWVVAANPPQGRIDLLRVAIHEFGHSLGIGHNQDNQIAIMDPSVSNIRTLQGWDIEQVRMRYSQDVNLPPPPDAGEGTDLAGLFELIAQCIRQMPPQQKAALERWLD